MMIKYVAILSSSNAYHFLEFVFQRSLLENNWHYLLVVNLSQWMVPIMAIQLTNSTLCQADQIEVQRICDCIYKLRSLGLDFYEYTYIKTISLYQSSGR